MARQYTHKVVRDGELHSEHTSEALALKAARRLQGFSNGKLPEGTFKVEPIVAPTDFRVTGSGTIYILWANSEAAQEWVEQHLPEDRLLWGRNGTAVEHRYISDIVDGIVNDGLSVDGL